MVKIRIGFEKALRRFEDQHEAFRWVRNTFKDRVRYLDYPFVFSVLSYEQDSLEAMDRWYFDGDRFTRENITS